MEPDVTRNGIGVGHGLGGEELTEDRVLDNNVCGHCGGVRPTASMSNRPCRPKHHPQPDSDLGTPKT